MTTRIDNRYINNILYIVFDVDIVLYRMLEKDISHFSIYRNIFIYRNMAILLIFHDIFGIIMR